MKSHSHIKEIIHSSGMKKKKKSCRGLSGLGLVPVVAQLLLAQLPLALGLVLVQYLRQQHSRLHQFVGRLVVLPGVPLALAGSDHGDLVGPRAAVLALQLDALRAGFIVDAAPVLAAAPPTPRPAAVGAADPVLEHRGRETLTGAHQLLDGVDASAVAV